MQSQLAYISQLLVLAVLAGHSVAVFYTKSKDTDYPRIGRRSYYTPGLGRSANGPEDSGHIGPRLLLLAGSPEGASATQAFSKRGVFTQGTSGLPRIGRRSDGAEVSSLDFLKRRHILERLAEFKDDATSVDDDSGLRASEEDGEMSSAEARSIIPLEIMFMAFDSDGDGHLSKDEFASGMRKYRQQNPLC